MTKTNLSRLARFKPIIKLLITVLAAYYLFIVATENLEEIKSINFPNPFKVYGAIFISLLLYGLVISALVLAWIMLLEYRQRHSLAIIYFKSQLLKYLPGNFFHFAYRHKESVDLGLTHKQVMKATILESTGLILAAFFMAHLSLFHSSYDLQWLSKINFPLSLLLILDVLVLIVAIRWMKWRFFYTKLVCYLAYFLGMGIILKILIWAWGFNPQPVLLMTTCYALSWLAGYLLPGAPGGIGVREAVFVAVSGPALLESEALVLISIIRLVSLTYEIILYFLASKISQLMFRQSLDTK